MQYIRRELSPTNFDWKFERSISEVWNEAEVVTAFFHFCLTLLYHAHLIPNVDLENIHHVKILKTLVILTWLPAENITEAFMRFTQSLTPELRNIFHPILNFFKDAVIQNPSGVYSVFEKEYLLINLTERTVARLRHRIRHNTYGIWPLYEQCLKTAEYA